VTLHKKGICLSAVALFASTLLIAQDRDAVMAQLAATKTYLVKQRSAPDYRDSIRKSALAYQNTLDTHCKDVNLDFDSADVKDRVLALLELNGKGTPIAGAWRESIPGAACNEKHTYNVQVEITSKGLRFTPTFPGDAAGNPELQNDTLRNIETNLQMIGVQTKKSCHIAVVDTHLEGAPSAPLSNGILSPWKESWSVQDCGKIYRVPVTYTPDDRGTRISVGTSEIHPL
jgi:hypothetical protein